MSAHAAAVATLAHLDAYDAGQQELRTAYLDHLARHPDGLLRGCRPDHLTASVVVLSDDAEQVLLTLHAKAGRWFQLGGHIEERDASLVAAAERELAEESGLAGLAVDPHPVQLDAHAVDFCGDSPARHLDVRFLAVAPVGENPPVASEESLRVAWWPVASLPSEEPSLLALVDAGRRRMGCPPLTR
ncbi:NUDIX domain-containing protein [Nocardioidaceae bacterium]|nr:NUDIX domain-containing protein [Nocardioidaceae bacterium]